jgi:hypothetical protein
MEWSFSKEKEMSLQEIVDFFFINKACNRKPEEKLHGKLAYFAQSMSIMNMKGFCFNVLRLVLNKFGSESDQKKFLNR